MELIINLIKPNAKAIAGFAVGFAVLWLAKFGFSLSFDFQNLLINLVSSVLVGGVVYQVPNKK